MPLITPVAALSVTPARQSAAGDVKVYPPVPPLATTAEL